MLRNEDGGGRYFLAVDLATIHVLHGVLRLVGVRELDVGEPAVQVRVASVRRNLNRLDRSVDRKYFCQVLPSYIASQASDMDSDRFWRWRPFTSPASR